MRKLSVQVYICLLQLKKTCQLFMSPLYVEYCLHLYRLWAVCSVRVPACFGGCPNLKAKKPFTYFYNLIKISLNLLEIVFYFIQKFISDTSL